MSHTLAVGQLKSKLWITSDVEFKQIIANLMADLVAAGTGIQIEDSLFFRCANRTFVLKTDGSLEYSEPAA